MQPSADADQKASIIKFTVTVTPLASRTSMHEQLKKSLTNDVVVYAEKARSAIENQPHIPLVQSKGFKLRTTYAVKKNNLSPVTGITNVLNVIVVKVGQHFPLAGYRTFPQER